MKDLLIGFIGQGWIGKNYADSFCDRGFNVVRYALEEPYIENKERIGDCDIVFIAVPTPTTEDGFNCDVLKKVISLVGKGKVAVIKSTIVPGTTEALQRENPEIIVLHSPEFLEEVKARHDSDNPKRNIIGLPVDNTEYRLKASEVMDVLPKADYELVCEAKTAELIKYAGNVFLFWKVIYANMLYDLSEKLGVEYDVVKEAVGSDSRITHSHLNSVHKSGRGAGGHCFIKDFAAFCDMYRDHVGDLNGNDLLGSMRKVNLSLLKGSDKDLDLLRGVYGEDFDLKK